jgi:hypothetical protein
LTLISCHLQDYHEHSCLTRYQNLYVSPEEEKPVGSAPEEYEGEIEDEEGYYGVDEYAEKENSEVGEAMGKGKGEMSSDKDEDVNDEDEEEEFEEDEDDD